MPAEGTGNAKAAVRPLIRAASLNVTSAHAGEDGAAHAGMQNTRSSGCNTRQHQVHHTAVLSGPRRRWHVRRTSVLLQLSNETKGRLLSAGTEQCTVFLVAALS